MKNIFLNSAAAVALLASGHIASAQSTAPSDRPGAEAPASKPAPPKEEKEPKAKSDKKEAPAGKPNSAASPEPKSAPSKATSDTKEPAKAPKSSQDKSGAPKATSGSKEPAAKSNTTSSPQDKSAPPKASTETKEAPGKPKTATTPEPKSSTPPKAGAETKQPTSPTAGPTASPPANNAATKPSDSKAAQPPAQQGAANSSTKAPAAVPPEKAAKINDVITRGKVEPINNVNFSLSVGVDVPSTVTVRPLPSSIVEIVPEYRGYDYIVVREEIVIIEPRTRKIVTVVHRGGGASVGTRSSSTRIALTPDRRKLIKQTLIRTTSRPSQPSVRLTVGAEVPQSYEIREFPTEIVRESPELKEYEYVVVEENVFVVDRRDRRVIEIID